MVAIKSIVLSPEEAMRWGVLRRKIQRFKKIRGLP